MILLQKTRVQFPAPTLYRIITASNSSSRGSNISGLGGDPNSGVGGRRHTHMYTWLKQNSISNFCLCTWVFYLSIFYATHVSGALEGQKTAWDLQDWRQVWIAFVGAGNGTQVLLKKAVNSLNHWTTTQRYIFFLKRITRQIKDF